MSKRRIIRSQLSKHRATKGMTQAKLAEGAGMSQAQIDRLEKKLRGLSLKWAKVLADQLDCHWSQLLEAVTMEKLSRDEAVLVGKLRDMSAADRAAALHAIDTLATQDKKSR